MKCKLFYFSPQGSINWIYYREKKRVNSEFVLHWYTIKKFAFKSDQIGLSTVVGFVVDC